MFNQDKLTSNRKKILRELFENTTRTRKIAFLVEFSKDLTKPSYQQPTLTSSTQNLTPKSSSKKLNTHTPPPTITFNSLTYKGINKLEAIIKCENIGSINIHERNFKDTTGFINITKINNKSLNNGDNTIEIFYNCIEMRKKDIN